MNRQRLSVAAAVSLIALGALALSFAAASAQDAPIAETFQKKCLTCHGPAAAEGPNKGPSLKGIAGKAIAATKGYEYSPGLKAHAKEKWTDANLDKYLTKPRDFATDGKMLPSVADPDQRKAIIAYLKTVK